MRWIGSLECWLQRKRGLNMGYTIFGRINSKADLRIVQQKVEVAPAPPKLNFIDIPGANGSKDATEALGNGVVYGDREIKWTFALYPGDDWETRKTIVSNAINGMRDNIILSDDPGYYYVGRIVVEGYTKDKMLRQITVKATCEPYKLKNREEVVSAVLSTGEILELQLCNGGKMAVIPTLEFTDEVRLQLYDGTTGDAVSGSIAKSAGKYLIPDFQLLGKSLYTLKIEHLGEASETTLTATWQEGDL